MTSHGCVGRDFASTHAEHVDNLPSQTPSSNSAEPVGDRSLAQWVAGSASAQAPHRVHPEVCIASARWAVCDRVAASIDLSEGLEAPMTRLWPCWHPAGHHAAQGAGFRWALLVAESWMPLVPRPSATPRWCLYESAFRGLSAHHHVDHSNIAISCCLSALTSQLLMSSGRACCRPTSIQGLCALMQRWRFDNSSSEVSLELAQVARILILDPTPAWSKSPVAPVGVVWSQVLDDTPGQSGWIFGGIPSKEANSVHSRLCVNRLHWRFDWVHQNVFAIFRFHRLFWIVDFRCAFQGCFPVHRWNECVNGFWF